MTGGVIAAIVAAPLASAESFSASEADDRLSITVTGSSIAEHNRTYELTCHPVGGSHPEAAAACARLDELFATEDDPFAPVPPNSMCTKIYGGPAKAEITGTWRGERVRASFSRTDGCEIARWNKFAPVLPVERA